ncbi:L-2-hydroxyglutarate oxidase [Luteococcus sp. H138]|uniref:L-2-hydroxyglutarate oxidase n=1 Tax=unclassified Luteococcus TaxID=2639923 RepID=UPI00313B4F28
MSEHTECDGVYDYLVVGAGIVGLATALTLLEKRPGSSLLVVDKEAQVAAHQTGHNSGVIHAGVYYAPGSKKALFCKQGAQWTRDFCDANGIAYRNTGKLIVATNELELERMHKLFERATLNELDVELIDGAELRRREPNVVGLGAIVVKQTGIVDYREVCAKMADKIVALGGAVRLSTPVAGIHESLSEVSVDLGGGTGNERVYARQLVVCGGIQADRLARMAGLEPDFQMVPFRGEYYRLAPQHNSIVSALIYPVPDPDLPFLGVHLTPMMDGTVTVGPNAVMGFAREGYPKLSIAPGDVVDFVRFKGFWKLAKGMLRTGIKEQWDSVHKPSYLKRVQKYCPKLTTGDLGPYPPGIRAQAVRADGTMVEDFHFLQTARMLHVCNAPSPAATSAMPIANHITEQLLGT